MNGYDSKYHGLTSGLNGNGGGTAVDPEPVSIERVVMTRDYCGAYTYRNGAVERILMGNGFLQDSAYYVQIKDYQGNVRTVIDRNRNIVEHNEYYPYGGLINASNSQLQPYKYSSKELDRENGLDLYDFSARMYDPMLPQFNGVDALSEKKPWNSPYVYCGGNPINRIDPTGNDWVTTKDGVIMWDENVTSKENIPDGATYLGKTYKGLVVYEYDEVLDPYDPENGVGIRVVFGYNTDNDNDNFDNMNWFQTVTDNPPSRLSNPFVDADKLYLNDDNKITLKNYAAENKYDSDVYFMDVPSRFKYTESQWDAELSLVKNANVSPQIILTLTYGFSVGKDNKSHAKSIILKSSPTEEHNKLFNSTIKW